MSGTIALSPGGQSSPRKLRLLLAEDELSFSAFLCELLAEEYEVEATSNGEQAWAAVARRLPEIILSDVQMPLLDGLGLLGRIRADTRTASVPFILMTADNQRSLLFAALEAGMDDFLPKPFHPLELLARLRCQRRMIDLRQQATEQIARKEAEAVEQVRNRFLSSLSHELREPLTPVRLASSLLRRVEGLPASMYEAIEAIRRNVEIETWLIDDLLDVSQIVDGRLAVNLASTDLHDCLGQAIRECREDYALKRLHFTVDLDAKQHQVRGDTIRLRQVFCRLLHNAGKFTPEYGRISVRSSNDSDSIVVEVQDSGSGIAADVLPRLFGPFGRNMAEKGQNALGLGLGMTIAHAIVTAHEGHLTAQSPGSGLGATFRVCLNTHNNSNSPPKEADRGPTLPICDPSG